MPIVALLLYRFDAYAFYLSFDMFHDDGNSTFIYDVNLNSKKVLRSIPIPLNDINNPDYYIKSFGINKDKDKWYFLVKKREYILTNYSLYVYNIKNNSIKKIPYQYPFFDYKILDSDYFYPYSTQLIHNDLAIWYSFRSSVTKINTTTDEVSEIKIENNYLDTNFMYSKTISKYKGLYSNLNYFPTYKIYRRRIKLGYEYGKKEIFAYYDTLFNVIGYQLVPKDIIFESNGVFYSFNLNQTILLLKIHSKPIIERIPKEDFDIQLKEIYNKYNTVCTINHFDP